MALFVPNRFHTPLLPRPLEWPYNFSASPHQEPLLDWCRHRQLWVFFLVFSVHPSCVTRQT